MVTLDERIPAEIQPLIQAHLYQVNHLLLGWVEGIYLVGSIGLGAFDPLRSDVDFIATTTRSAGKKELSALQQLHDQLRRAYPLYKMEGSYIRRQDLGKTPREIPPSPCIHDNELNPSGHHDINPVTWWILRENGLPVSGPETASLAIKIQWPAVLTWMDENLVTYWGEWTHWLARPKRMAALMTDWGVEWSVLGVLRPFYSFRENGITSKLGAGTYALEALSAEWHPIVSEAIAIREGRKERYYSNRLKRAAEAAALIKAIILARQAGGTEL